MNAISELPTFNWNTPESIHALKGAYDATTKGSWWAEVSLTKPSVSITGDGLRSVVARLDENSLCLEHGGSALGNALFIARAHEMMPFLLACVELAQQAAAGDLVDDALREKAQRLFD
jgi:hypothetical protein